MVGCLCREAWWGEAPKQSEGSNEETDSAKPSACYTDRCAEPYPSVTTRIYLLAMRWDRLGGRIRALRHKWLEDLHPCSRSWAVRSLAPPNLFARFAHSPNRFSLSLSSMALLSALGSALEAEVL